jgi:vacuolar-type H+-ATPase subunit I/STV1
MNTFQLLKSGTSFKKDRISKVKPLFKPEGGAKKQQLNDSDDDLIELDKQLEELKQSKPKDLDKFNQQVTHLVNKKRDTLNLLRKKHHIKIEGDSCPQPLFSFP